MKQARRIQLGAILLIIEICCSNAVAGSPDSLSVSSQRSALQLDFIRVSGVSYLLPLTGSKRIRFGLDVSVSSNNGTNSGNSSYVIVYPDTTSNEQRGYSSASNSFSGSAMFSAIYLVDILSFKSGAVYGGLGPFITYSRSYSNSSTPYARDTLSSESRSSSSSHGWTFGVRAALEIQVQVTTDIAVHAEYTLSPGYQETISNGVATVDESGSNGYRRTGLSKNESRTKRSTWGLGGANAGILFYF